MTCPRNRPVRRRRPAPFFALVVLCALPMAALAPWAPRAPTAGAASDVGASTGGTTVRQRYSPPLDAPVVDPFRRPDGPYGAGNRGLEYATAPGAVVRSIGAGRVAFAGQVAGRLVVSVDHPDGLRSSLVGLAAISVRVGDLVGRGTVVGRAARTLHVGVRRAGEYLDPATLFGARGPARLVPLVEPGGRSATRRRSLGFLVRGGRH